LAVVISLFSGFLALSGGSRAVDWLYYDKVQQLSTLPPAKDIVIIEIDNKSISKIGRWPWPREIHAQLLDKLSNAHSKAVIFDVLFPDLDPNNPQSDQRFAKAIKENGKVILPIYIETLGQQGQVIESPPADLFYSNALSLGHVHLEIKSDGIVRAVFLKEGVGSAFWPHLSLALLEALKLRKEESLYLSGARAPKTDLLKTSLSIEKDFHNLLPMPATQQGLVHFSYSDILDDHIAPIQLRGKLVYIGASAAGLGDVLATPIGIMTGVELNAWIFHALRNNLLIQNISEETLSVFTFIIVLLLITALGHLSPKIFLIFTLFSISSILILSATLLLFRQIWLPPIPTVIGLVLFFPLWSWLRVERVLRFLRNEIEELSSQSQFNHPALHMQNQATLYLEKIGMISPSTGKQSVNGINAAKTLQLYQPANSETEHFWKNQISKESNNAHDIKHKKIEGVELIAKTVSQLSNIKKNDFENRQLIEKSLSQLQDAVCIADLCGRVTFTNKLFELWFEEALQQHPKQQPRPLLDTLNSINLNSGKKWSQALSLLYQSGKEFSEEATLASSDKQLLCQANLVSINDAQYDTLILTFIDITQLKVVEKARADALSFLSHDLRAPMVSVLAILERNQTSSLPLAPSLPIEAIQSIETLVRKNLDYAESFLQLSKADSLTETVMTPCDLHAVIDGAQVYAVALASAKSMNIVVERCDEETWVLGDLSLLERALNNLISNAVKFSPTGATIQLKLARTTSEILLSVSDQGSGIDKKDQDRLFDKFTRIKRAKPTAGAGLGLHFVATVVRKHKGNIFVNSKLNVGSTFAIHLPALTEQNLF